jgi:Uma2 family endonuclease
MTLPTLDVQQNTEQEALQPLPQAQIMRWRFNVRDYEAMYKSGVLTEDDRVELIAGEVRAMSPIGATHAGSVNLLVSVLSALLGKNYVIAVQNPVRINEYNEPQPDLAVLKAREDFYRTSHPTPADVLLLIEVADTSVAYDRLEKIPRYAAAGIPEVWLMNTLEKYIEQYTEPSPSGYGKMQRLAADTMIKASQVEGLELPISQIL